MKQIEFEDKVRQMRHEKAQAINQFALMQNEVKEEIAAKNRQISEMTRDVQKLKMQLTAIHERRMKADNEWSNRINQFISDYHDSAQREWDEISTYTIIKQLRKRGWKGTIYNEDPTIPDDHKQGVISAFGGDETPIADDTGGVQD